ncbi:MAG TPA: protein kinase [Ktedonobacterales bacterium]|nr:protein kinase [Ktedonobacterales bacterium]
MRCLDPGCRYGENPADAIVCRCGLLLPGARVAGRYQVERLIGRGDVSVVYQARDLRLKRPVALKALRALSNEQARARFINEAELAAALDHINILAVLDFGQDGPITYLVMPLMAGGTLEDVMRQYQGPLPVATAASYFRQLASALDYAHSHPRKILHRDVKPSNVLVHPGDGRLLLTDFSIARALEAERRLTAAGLALGTPNYAAPEQMRGHPVPASDQYAAAVVLYEMLTGRLPFTASSVMEQTRQHLYEPPPPPNTVNPRLPAEVNGILLHALAKDPTKRFRTVTACADALEAALALTPRPKAAPVEAAAPLPVGSTDEIRQPLAAGKRLRGGRVEVMQLLREEASGELYLVNEQGQSPRQRALLRLAAESSGPRAAQRVHECTQVAHALMALGEHPAIPRYYESFQEKGETFFLIEYIQGETLAVRLAQAGKPLREEEALLAASQTLDALVTLAQLTPPVVHRNVKPSNLLRRATDGRTYLVGFDIALVAAPPVPGEKPRIEPRGTRGYSPPEQASRDRLPDPRWDLYALGATLHHLLTNRDPQKERPFDFPLARSLNTALSPDVERLLERAVARDANSRYHTAVEMKRDIDRLLGLTCPQCGAPLRRQARFCGRCGARLISKGAG